MERNDAVATDWTSRVEGCFQAMAKADKPSPNLHRRLDADARHITRPEWGGFPVRVTRCIPRRAALEVLDWRTDHGDEGRRRLQEEYLEWRTVRDTAGRITRVEMTTEFPESWYSLAAQDPDATMRIVAERAEEANVAPAALYGDLDPFAAGVSALERERAFAEVTLSWGARNPYNDGERAICCMAHPTNTLRALIELVARATFPFVVIAENGDERCATSAEILPRIWGSAQPGRNSDPVLVERLARLAFEARLVALDEPVGVYVTGVEHTRLRSPDGSVVPAEWFTLQPGALTPFLTDEPAGFQRLVFEVPSDVGLSMEQLTDIATEEPIRYGGQIADLVQLSLPLKTSDAGIVTAEPELLPAAGDQPPLGCEEVVDVLKAYRGTISAS